MEAQSGRLIRKQQECSSSYINEVNKRKYKSREKGIDLTFKWMSCGRLSVQSSDSISDGMASPFCENPSNLESEH